MADPASIGRPAALFIAPIMPSDRGNGLAMRTGFLLDSYAKRFAIDLAVVPVAAGATTLTPFVEARVRRAVVLPTAAPDTHFTLIGSVADAKARLAAFRQYGRPSITARLSGELERALLGFTGEASYQLVHVSRLYLASLAAAWMHAGGGPPRLVLDCDEDDVSAYRRFALLHRKWGRARRAAWAEAEADAFKALGHHSLPRFDLLLAASAGEARLLKHRAGDTAIAVIPNVAPASPAGMTRPRMREGRRDILFVGNMGYLPNIDAAMWFATRIWPRLRSALPFPSRFVIAGNGAPREVVQLGRRPGIALAGPFEDAGRLYHRAALAVVPIRAGGGTRIKLLESAAHEVPIVATRIGAEGTGFRSGRELLLADNEQDFASSCARLLTDSKLASRLVAGARGKVRRDYAAARATKVLLDRIDPWFAKE
jgi:glycosyltransferase involved in cell wall biosynthesis